MMFCEKYKPNNLSEFIGNPIIKQLAINWLNDWDKEKQQCLFLTGNVGVGKSLLAELLAKNANYTPIYVTDDSKEYWTYLIPRIQSKKSIQQTNSLLIINDCNHSISYIKECILKSSIPIICTYETINDQIFKPIKQYCYCLTLISPTFDELFPLLKNLVIQEKIQINKTTLKKMYKGDVRFLLNMLQFHNKYIADKDVTITNAVHSTELLFSNEKSFDEKYEIYWLDYSIHNMMIPENYAFIIGNVTNVPKCTFNTVLNKFTKSTAINDQLYNSSHYISDSNIIQSSNNWELMPHIAVSLLSATHDCPNNTITPQFYHSKYSYLSTFSENKRVSEKPTKKRTSEDKKRVSDEPPKKRGRPKKNNNN